MTQQDLLSYQDTMADVTKDIHEACPGLEINVMWDDGKLRMVTGDHKVRVWNDLGEVYLHVGHDILLERGNAYKGFLTLLTVQIEKSLRL